MPYANKAVKIVYDALWRNDNYEHMNEVDTDWHKNNREKHSVTSAKYAASKRNSEGAYTEQQWIALCNRYENKCLCCRKKISLEPDHIIPISMGGTNWISNIQPLCHSCNTSKGNRRTTDYRNQHHDLQTVGAAL